MYVNSITCLRVKGGESECPRIENYARQVCIMFPWPFNVYMDAAMKEVNKGMERMEERFLEEGRDCRLPGFLYTDDLVLCG